MRAKASLEIFPNGPEPGLALQHGLDPESRSRVDQLLATCPSQIVEAKVGARS
jgi:hypothetical protein